MTAPPCRDRQAWPRPHPAIFSAPQPTRAGKNPTSFSATVRPVSLRIMRGRRAMQWLKVRRNDAGNVGDRPAGDDRDGDHRLLRARGHPGCWSKNLAGRKRGSASMPAAPLSLEPGWLALVEPHDWKSSLRKPQRRHLAARARSAIRSRAGGAPAERQLRRTDVSDRHRTIPASRRPRPRTPGSARLDRYAGRRLTPSRSPAPCSFSFPTAWAVSVRC
jgi:hypothetical protein